jgi:hypothetical protein
MISKVFENNGMSITIKELEFNYELTIIIGQTVSKSELEVEDVHELCANLLGPLYFRDDVSGVVLSGLIKKLQAKGHQL